MADLAILYEHPEWFRPLFAALDARGIDYRAFTPDGAAAESATHISTTPEKHTVGAPATPSHCSREEHAFSGVDYREGASAVRLELRECGRAIRRLWQGRAERL